MKYQLVERDVNVLCGLTVTGDSKDPFLYDTLEEVVERIRRLQNYNEELNKGSDHEISYIITEIREGE